MAPNPQARRNPNPSSTQDPEEEEGGRMWKRRRAPISPNPTPSTSEIVPRSNQEPTSNNNSKKKKKKPTANFASIWTPEDEIKILEGIIEHKENDGEILSIRTLLAAIAPSLSFAATDRQLRDKIRHLKTGYDNASDSKKSRATGHKGIVYRLCDRIWPASPAIKEEEEEEDSYDSYDSEDYPELRVAVERRAGYLIFEEVVESLSKDEAESFNERFWKLREDEKRLWKEINERLQW